MAFRVGLCPHLVNSICIDPVEFVEDIQRKGENNPYGHPSGVDGGGGTQQQGGRGSQQQGGADSLQQGAGQNFGNIDTGDQQFNAGQQLSGEPGGQMLGNQHQGGQGRSTKKTHVIGYNGNSNFTES